MGILDLYNPRKIKENWSKVRSNPYASLKFQYYIALGVVGIVSIFVVWTIVSIILKYDGGSSIMTMITRGILLVVMVMIVLKAWSVLTPLRMALKHYEENPATQKSVSKPIDIGKEVDEILSNIEKNK